MAKIDKTYLKQNCVDADIVNLGDDYDWSGEHDFTAGTVSVSAPSSGSHPVQYSYLLSLNWKKAARVRAQGNIDLSAPGATIDGESMSTDMRVCCDQQTVTTQDGVYLWKGASTPMVRTDDFASGTGVAMFAIGIEAGSDSGKIYSFSNEPGSDVVGTDDLSLKLLSGEPDLISNIMGTCLVTGGALSTNADPTKFNVSAGSGYIVNNYSDPLSPTRKLVSWSSFTGVSDEHLSDTATFVSVNIDGNIVQTASIPAMTDYASYILLGAIGHEGGYVAYIANTPVSSLDLAIQFRQFLMALGDFSILGNEIVANGANLYLDRTAGTVHSPGSGFQTDKRTPNLLSLNSASHIYFLKTYRDSSGDWVFATIDDSIDPDYYDPDGATDLVAVTSTYWTVQKIFFTPQVPIVIIQYGQDEYATKGDAVAAINDSFEVNPFVETVIFRGSLVVKQGATVLNDTDYAEFFPSTSKFGITSGSGGSGGSGGEANTASNVGTSGVGVFYQKSGVDLQFKNVKAASSKVTVIDNPTPHTIDLDVVPGNIAHQDLSGAGVNTHSQIDTAVSTVNGAFPGVSIDNEIVLWSGTTGKVLKRATITGILKATSGVIAQAISGTDYEPPISTGTSGQFYSWDKTWRVPTYPLPIGYKRGLKVSRNSSNPTYQVDISAGSCRSDDNTFNMVNPGTIVVSLAASGANGLDTGSEASNTWYYVWLIYNPTTLTYAGLFSTSSVSPTMPSGYTLKRRIFSVRNNASSNFLNWTQILGDDRLSKVMYDLEDGGNVTVLSGGTSTSYVDVSLASFIPPTSRLAILNLQYVADSTSEYMKVRPNGSTSDPPVFHQRGGNSSLLASASSSAQHEVTTDASQTIEYANSATGGNSTILVNGFYEEL